MVFARNPRFGPRLWCLMWMLALFLWISSDFESLSAQEAQTTNAQQTSKELIAELERLKTIPTPRSFATDAEKEEYAIGQRLRFNVAEQLMKVATDAEIRRSAIDNQFDSLRVLTQMKTEGALDALWQTANAFSNDFDPLVAGWASKYIRTIRLQRLYDGDRSQASELFEAVARWVRSEEFGVTDATFAFQAASGLEKAESYPLAISLYQEIAKRVVQFPPSSQSRGVLDKIDKAQQRLSIIGRRLSVEGRMIEGRHLEASFSDGKIVLLDFWASWCLPCREEMPLIRRMLDRYGEHGFVVVGICVDEDIESAKRFLSQDGNVDWPILFETIESRRALNHPLARAVGVDKLPTAILLDRKGRVISAVARGENLERWLTEIFNETKSRRSLLKPAGQMMTRGEDPELKLKHK